jgi:hypothetical protein
VRHADGTSVAAAGVMDFTRFERHIAWKDPKDMLPQVTGGLRVQSALGVGVLYMVIWVAQAADRRTRWLVQDIVICIFFILHNVPPTAT